MDLLCFCSVLCLLCLCACLFICALWSPAWKGLTSWLSFVVSTVSLSLSHLEFLRLKVGCTGLSASTLVKIPHCWKSHVTAHINL